MKPITAMLRFNRSTWTYKGFHGVLHTFFPVASLESKFLKIFGDAVGITLFFVQGTYVHWYWNDAELTRIRNRFFRQIKKDPRYLHTLLTKWRRALRAFDRLSDKLRNVNLRRCTDGELAAWYDCFYEAYTDEFCYFMSLGDAISMHADRYLVPEFRSVLGRDFNEVFPQLVTTTHRSFIDEERLARQKLVERYRKTNDVTPRLLQAHADKFFYVANNYARGEALSPSYFLRLIRDEAQQPRAAVSVASSRNRRARLMRAYQLSPWQRQLLTTVNEFFGIQDTRKQYVLKANYYQMNFLREAARRTGIPVRLLYYTIYSEFRSVLTKKISLATLRKRQKLSLFVRRFDQYEIITGRPAAAALKFFQGETAATSIVNGIVASAGRATGRVKVILTAHDMVNMASGDILVASMTRPEMVPAMKKAAAVVTDEGGITSHAAIVSRELGIPCVIGTKVATKVFKDGDRIEVDASKGIVKKL